MYVYVRVDANYQTRGARIHVRARARVQIKQLSRHSAVQGLSNTVLITNRDDIVDFML